MGALINTIDTEIDARLIDEHRNGELRAYAELYERHYDRLLSYCRQRIRDWHLAEEVAQETFVRAFTASLHLRDGQRFYPWLTVIASRLAVDDFRRSGRVVLKSDPDPGHEPAADEPLIQLEELEALKAAMARVVPRHREILRLREEEGLSYDAIAQLLGTPATTIPPLLHRARSALRREFLAANKLGRVSGLWLLPGAVIAEARRWRDRATQTLANLPDMHGLSVPVVSVVWTVAVFIAPLNTGVDLVPLPGDDPPTLGNGFDTPVGLGELSGEFDRAAMNARIDASPPPPTHVVGAVEITADSRRSHWGQDQTREMPIYFEYGDTAVGADPNSATRGVDKTMRGDLGWMQGKCNDGEGC